MDCERCEVSDMEDNSYDIKELQIGFGTLTAFCHQCRKEWLRYSATHETFRAYAETGFKMDCWRVYWRKKPGDTGDYAKGMALYKELETYEYKLIKIADSWIRAGITDRERERRDEG